MAAKKERASIPGLKASLAIEAHLKMDYAMVMACGYRAVIAMKVIISMIEKMEKENLSGQVVMSTQVAISMM
jgi:hypothetical protein